MEDTRHIEGITGAVVSGQVINSKYKFNVFGFGVPSEYEHTGISKFIKEPEDWSTGKLTPELFEGEDGKKIKDILEYAGVILVLEPILLPILNRSFGEATRIRLVDFYSIFGMGPMDFLTASLDGHNDVNHSDSEQVGSEVASYMTHNLLDYHIFARWIRHIKSKFFTVLTMYL